MRRAVIVSMLLITSLAHADRDGRGRGNRDRDWGRDPGDPVVLDRRELLKDLKDAQELLESMVSRERDRGTRRRLDAVLDQIDELQEAVSEAPRLGQAAPSGYRGNRFVIVERGVVQQQPVGPPPPAQPAVATVIPTMRPIGMPVPPGPAPGSAPPAGQPTYAQNQPQPQQGNVFPIAQPNFDQLKGAIDRERMPSDKMRLITQASPSHWFLIAHVREVIQRFNFPSDKLKVVQVMKPRILDMENSYMLNQEFTFSSDKAQLQRILSQP
jgi:hypothetical protein